MSSSTTLRLQDQIMNECEAKLVEAIKAGKRFRLVGDNINFQTQVRDERKDRHGKMEHYFGSAAIIQTLDFEHLPSERPVVSNINLPQVMLTEQESEGLVDDYGYMMMKVAATHLPYFSFLKDLLPENITDEYSAQLTQKTPVIPLIAMHKNEQHYGDVVDIMRFYEDLLKRVHTAAGQDLGNRKVHVGGDQLTRERFSGAKLLVIGAHTPGDRFDNLSPITFEYFHLAMKFLSVCFKVLFNTESTEVGSMKGEATRIHRRQIKEKVRDAYNEDKDYFLSFTNAYIVEAVCDYFGMDDHLSSPTTAEVPEDEKYEWAKSHFGRIVKRYTGTFMQGEHTLYMCIYHHNKCIEFIAYIIINNHF